MDSDGSDIADYRGDYSSAATDPVKKRKHKNKKVTFGLFAIISILASAAILLSISAYNRANQVFDSKIEEKNQLIVANCEQVNRSRQKTYEALITLAAYSLASRPDPNAPPDKLVTDYVTYLQLAFDPVNCNLGAIGFGEDLSPPPELPVNEALNSILSTTTTVK